MNADNIRDNEKIELFLRYYLFKIVDELKHPESYEYRLTHFGKETFNGIEVQNPFPEKEEIIKQDIIRRYSDLANRIKEFEDDIKELNQWILDFQGSLQSVINKSVLGLKGSCIIDKEFSLKHKNKVISCLARHWHSVSK